VRPIARLGEHSEFPPTEQALEYPNGLLAVGGGLSTQRLLAAYSLGIFPWYEEPQPVLWWSPDPRSILFPEELHISRSLRKTLRSNRFSLRLNTRFHEVMKACACLRGDGLGTWIDDAMTQAYCRLHREGHAHSIEVFDAQEQLVGGLYGVALGATFFGESMFSHATDASKVALVALVNIAHKAQIQLIDCQVESDHLNSMGARNINRQEFEQRLAHTVHSPVDSSVWSLPKHCGDLL